LGGIQVLALGESLVPAGGDRDGDAGSGETSLFYDYPSTWFILPDNMIIIFVLR
jgi:hypothetical protein